MFTTVLMASFSLTTRFEQTCTHNFLSDKLNISTVQMQIVINSIFPIFPFQILCHLHHCELPSWQGVKWILMGGVSSEFLMGRVSELGGAEMSLTLELRRLLHQSRQTSFAPSTSPSPPSSSLSSSRSDIREAAVSLMNSKHVFLLFNQSINRHHYHQITLMFPFHMFCGQLPY